jgi:signal transduction histidine kinase
VSEGLGLGLYIVRQLVLAHGGAIDVTSTDAEGTTFRVTLPRRPPVPPAGGQHNVER